LASGIVAGAVSSEIRKHVQAALREVETRNRLERVEHDLGIARAIQQSLLPHIRPTMNGFEIAGWNRPADETGGDYFDWKHMPDGRLAVMLADVTGHGIGPAMLASECRAYARASFSNHQNLPGTFQRINESLEDDLAPNRFATFVAVVCKENNGEVELLSAGHGPLFIYSSETKTLRELSAQAVPFGILPTMVFEDTVILHLSPGDIVLLITDGFFEWENAAGEEFGVKRLGDTIRESSHLPPEEIIAELYNRVLAFAQGTKQNDDLTAVIIKRVLPCAVASPLLDAKV
jgi:serine phosphatase RsbU (regulator of sigma subunit)